MRQACTDNLTCSPQLAPFGHSKPSRHLTTLSSWRNKEHHYISQSFFEHFWQTCNYFNVFIYKRCHSFFIPVFEMAQKPRPRSKRPSLCPQQDESYRQLPCLTASWGWQRWTSACFVGPHPEAWSSCGAAGSGWSPGPSLLVRLSSCPHLFLGALLRPRSNQVEPFHGPVGSRKAGV